MTFRKIWTTCKAFTECKERVNAIVLVHNLLYRSEGLDIVRLLTSQLKGSLDIDRNAGTSIIITF